MRIIEDHASMIKETIQYIWRLNNFTNGLLVFSIPVSSDLKQCIKC